MDTSIIHGVVVRPDGIETTTLRDNRGRWAVADQSVLPLSGGGKAGAGAPPLLPEQLKPHAGALRGACALALPAGDLLMRVVDLPSTDPGELAGMVELQVDKFSPFPVEHLSVSFERLAGTETSTRVLIAAAQRSKIDEWGAAFREIGAALRWIDVDALGWWHLLQDRNCLSAQGNEVVLLCRPQSVILIVTQEAVPVVFRALDGPGGEPAKGYYDTLAEEVNFTLTSLETERGAMTPFILSVWHEGAVPAALMGVLRAACGADPVAHDLGGLPPLSEALAVRAVNRPVMTMDLAPREWSAAEQRRAVRRRLVTVTASLLAAWLVLVLAMSVVLGLAKRKLAGLDARVQELAEPARAVNDVREKVKTLERFTDPTYSVLEILRAVSTALPEGVELNSLTYARGGLLNLRGEADTETPIYDFSQRLQESGLFLAVRIERVETGVRQGRARAVFRLSADVGGGET